MAEEQNTENEETPAAPEEATADVAAPEAAANESPEASEAPAAQAAPPAEPEVVLAPKERRARDRATKAAKAGRREERSPEQRQADRDATRAQKAGARRVERERARTKHRESAHERTATPAREHEAGRQKTRQGIVVSDKAAKTIIVRIDTARRHRRYQKIVRTSVTLHAHDEQGDAHIGDTVIVRECRPLSRTKRWRLVQVVERAE